MVGISKHELHELVFPHRTRNRTEKGEGELSVKIVEDGSALLPPLVVFVQRILKCWAGEGKSTSFLLMSTNTVWSLKTKS